jgi:hypothetical protein
VLLHILRLVLIRSFSPPYFWKVVEVTHRLVGFLLNFELFRQKYDSNG